MSNSENLNPIESKMLRTLQTLQTHQRMNPDVPYRPKTEAEETSILALEKRGLVMYYRTSGLYPGYCLTPDGHFVVEDLTAIQHPEEPTVKDADGAKGVPYMHTLSEETRAVMRVIYATAPMDGEQILAIEIAQPVQQPHSVPEYAMPLVDQAYEGLRAAMLARKMKPLIELCYMGFIEQRATWPDGSTVYEDIVFYLTEAGREYCQEGFPLVTSMTFPIPE